MSNESERAYQLAKRFHETYERLAPQFGYKTREESAKPWENVPIVNQQLMTAVCAEILNELPSQDWCERKAREIAHAILEEAGQFDIEEILQILTGDGGGE